MSSVRVKRAADQEHPGAGDDQRGNDDGGRGPVCGVRSLARLLGLILGLMPWAFLVAVGLDLPVLPPDKQGAAPPIVPIPIPYPEVEPGDLPPVLPPPVFFGEEIEGECSRICYVLDKSGSMRWPRERPRWDRLREELARSLGGLSEAHRFNLVAYDCGYRAFREDHVYATAVNVAAALAWVGEIVPEGGTGTGPAVIVGLDGADRVCLVADGEANCPWPTIDPHRRAIRTANTEGVAIDVFGLDLGENRQAREFCQGIASDSGGSFFER